MSGAQAEVTVAAELDMFLRPGRRGGPVPVALDGTSSLGHLVESLGVHLGTLARRLRLLGLDTAYRNQADDAGLVEQANAEQRVLLTQDRALLHRRKLWLGAYVRGARPDDQLHDVLSRFAPPLALWTRCPACNGPLTPARKAAVDPVLQPGTRRSYQAFSRCVSCGRVYWRGAHSRRLEGIIAAAARAVRATP